MKNHFFSVFLSLQVWRQFINSRIPENFSCSEQGNIYIRNPDCFIGMAIKTQLCCDLIFRKNHLM
jgi:hypothetical protein